MRLSLSIAFVVAMAPCRLFADLAQQHMSHQRLVIPGGRSALLGGAYTALSDDPSGSYYNPAGLSFAKNNEITVNSWIQDASEVVFKGAVNGEDFHEESATRYASFVGGIFKHGIFTGGYSVVALDNRNINQNDTFSGISDQPGFTSDFKRVHQESNKYDLMGGSAAVRLGMLSIGSSAFYYIRTIEAMDYQLVQNVGGSGRVIESKYKVNNTGLVNVTGMTLRGSEMAVGLSYRSAFNQSNNSDFNYESVGYETDKAPTHTSITSTNTHIYDEIIPATLQIGAAWFPSPLFLVSADVLHHDGVKTDGTSPERISTFNYSLGFESAFSFVKLAVGTFSNFTMFKRIVDGGTNQPAHIDYYGYTGGLTVATKSQEATFGFVQQEGKGEAQIVLNSTDVQKVEAGSKVYLVSWRLKL